MSVKVMAAVWELDLPPTHKLVLLALADHAHSDGTSCFPGVERLASLSGLSPRTVQYALRALEQAGAVVRRERPGRPSDYTIPYAQWCNPCTMGVQPVHHGGATGAPSKGTVREPSPNRPFGESEQSASIEVCATPGCPIVLPCWLHQPDQWPEGWRLGRRDALWEAMGWALSEQPGVPEKPIGRVEQGRWAAAVKDLRQLGASPAELVRRGRAYRRRWPEVDITPTAIFANWRVLGLEKPGKVRGTLRAVAAARDALGG